VILWTIRLAGVLYVIALAQMIRRSPARAFWITGCVFYLAHVVAAFHYAYHWSHGFAVQETARQTRELFGLDWGGGIWFNYLFTVVWSADALWWLLRPKSRESRPKWLNASIHSYIAWMFINGAIVFPQGPTRWVAASMALTLAVWRLVVLVTK